MRVLVAHNRYRRALPSGENTVVDGDVAGLRERGVEVDLLAADSDDIADFGLGARLTLPGRPTWSADTRGRFRSLVEARPPDVMHLHNPYPLLSPAVVRWAAAAAIPVVQTVHNVRHACLAGTFARDGGICRDCVGRRVPWPGVLHGCYRSARGPSLALAVAHTAHRGTWRRVDRFLAVSGYVADVLAEVGLPPGRTVVRPNGIADPGPPSTPGAGVLFAGRLTVEKGIDLLLDVWADPALAPSAPLRIAGDGPLRARVEAAAARNPDVHDLGRLDRAAMHRELRRSAVVAVPSRAPEALPTVVIEAFAHARAVVATPVGAIPEMVDTAVGAIAEADPADLAAALGETLVDGEARGQAARRRYVDRYTLERSVDRLLSVYEEVSG